MLKQVVKFTNYNDEEDSETLYFNLNKVEVADMLDWIPRLNRFIEVTDGPERTLTTEEVKEFLSIVKSLIELSYGVRSEDGKHFRKSPEIFAEFKESAAYDAFVFSLFEDTEAAMSFMRNVLPKELRIEAQANQTVVQLPTEPVSTAKSEAKSATEGELSVEDFSDEDLLSMDKEQFERLVGKDPSKMSPRVLRVAFRRKNSAS